MQYPFHEIVKSQFHISVLCCPTSYIFLQKLNKLIQSAMQLQVRRDTILYVFIRLNIVTFTCIHVLLNAVSK